MPTSRSFLSSVKPMITIGSRVTIAASPELSEWRLEALIGRTTVVLEDLTDECREPKGYMVLIPDTYEDEFVWFIPQESVYEQD